MPAVDWNIEPMRIFRAYARHDFNALSAGAEAVNLPITHVIDQATASLRDKLLEAGIDLRSETGLFYFVLGSHLHWSHALGHVLATCDAPAICGHAFVVHSANASVGWRIALRAFIQNVDGIPEEPEADEPPEYVIDKGDEE